MPFVVDDIAAGVAAATAAAGAFHAAKTAINDISSQQVIDSANITAANTTAGAAEAAAATAADAAADAKANTISLLADMDIIKPQIDAISGEVSDIHVLTGRFEDVLLVDTPFDQASVDTFKQQYLDATGEELTSLRPYATYIDPVSHNPRTFKNPLYYQEVNTLIGNAISAANAVGSQLVEAITEVNRYPLTAGGRSAWAADVAAGHLVDNGLFGVFTDPVSGLVSAVVNPNLLSFIGPAGDFFTIAEVLQALCGDTHYQP